MGMAIQWNKVTWYSKFIALVLFVALPFVGFWLGIDYGKTLVASSTPITTPTISTTSGYYSTPSEWQTDQRTDAGFSFSYPLDFSVDDNYGTTQTTDWRLNSNNEPGLLLATLSIPSAFEPQTNFAGAKLTIGKSFTKNAVANCLQPDQSGGPATTATTQTINGTNFSVFTFSDAAAGSIYDTMSYRTVQNGACYAIEYTIHSSQIANYPVQYNLKPYDQAVVTDVLNRIVGTFSFN